MRILAKIIYPSDLFCTEFPLTKITETIRIVDINGRLLHVGYCNNQISSAKYAVIIRTFRNAKVSNPQLHWLIVAVVSEIRFIVTMF
jgi:hypothetical protein